MRCCQRKDKRSMNDNDSFDIKQACYAAYPIKR